MLNQNDKIERFSEIINKNALAQCKKIEKQTEKFRKEQLKELETKAKTELEGRLEYEAQRITTQKGSKISSLVSESRKNLAAKREEITACVFKKVEEKLSAFAKSDAYPQFLKKSVEALVEEVGEGAVVYVRKSDLEKCRALSVRGVGRFEESSKIRLGGAMASNSSGTVFAVDTLESRLEEQKEAFKQKADLAIDTGEVND